MKEQIHKLQKVNIQLRITCFSCNEISNTLNFGTNFVKKLVI